MSLTDRCYWFSFKQPIKSCIIHELTKTQLILLIQGSSYNHSKSASSSTVFKYSRSLSEFQVTHKSTLEKCLFSKQILVMHSSAGEVLSIVRLIQEVVLFF